MATLIVSCNFLQICVKCNPYLLIGCYNFSSWKTPWSKSILAYVFTYVHIILVAAMWVCMYNKCMLTECRKVKSKSNTAAKNEPVPSF